MALATAGLFIGVPYYRDEMAWRNARQGGQRPDYEGYLSQYPEGRHRQAAIDSLRRYEMIGRDTLGDTSPTTPEEPVDSVEIENLPVDSVQMDNPPISPPVTLVIPKEKKPGKKTPKPAPPKDKPANPPADKKPDPVVVKPPTPVVTSGIPSLSGIVAPFEMKPFSVVKNNGTEFQIKFLEHNEKGQALVTLAGKGDWVMRQEQELVFVLNGGDMVKAKLAYVAKSDEGWLNGYFLLDRSEIKKLADTKVNSLRLQDYKNPAVKGYPLTDGNRKELRQKAERALKKMPD